MKRYALHLFYETGADARQIHAHVDLDLTEIHMPSGNLLQEVMETFVKPFDVEKRRFESDFSQSY